MTRADVLYPIVAPLLAGCTAFPDWTATVERALAHHPTWRALGPDSWLRFLAAVWADLTTQHGHRRWLDHGLTDAEPWHSVTARVRRGVAVVTCPACSDTHVHAPAAARRFAACGRARYQITLAEPERPPTAIAE